MTAKVHSEGEWGARQGVRQETADKAVGGGIAAMVACQKEEGWRRMMDSKAKSRWVVAPERRGCWGRAAGEGESSCTKEGIQ